MRGWIKILRLKHYVLTSCCSWSNGWISIKIRNVDHFNFMHKRLNKNKIKDCFNFKLDRLNKKFLIIAHFLKMSNLRNFGDLALFCAVLISSMSCWIKILWLKLYVCLILTSCCSLTNGWISIKIRDVHHFNFTHKRLKENENLDCFNFKHERLNKYSLIIAPFLFYLDFFFVLSEMDEYQLQ